MQSDAWINVKEPRQEIYIMKGNKDTKWKNAQKEELVAGALRHAKEKKKIHKDPSAVTRLTC